MRLLALLIVLIPGPLLAADAFPLRDGDRVALVGNTFVERAQESGYLELALTLSVPKSDVVFRNLGWSGDVVTARARRYFGKTEEGFEHLLRHIDLVKPTVILVSYGTNEAFAGNLGREEFIQGYERLLNELSKRTDRIALITSPPLNPEKSPAPRIAERVNDELAWQVEALRDLTKRRDLQLIDVFTPLRNVFTQPNDGAGDWTTNGMHLTPRGYRLAAEVILNRAAGRQESAESLIADLAKTKPDAATEKLREAIMKKNRLFFHRHRPENETYLRGFRKHEQGNNAKEIYVFEDLTQEMDQQIFTLRQAVSK